jgi:thiol-disulfide isomerase/thioredoxin
MPLQIAWLPNGEDQIMFSDVFFVDSGSYKIRLDSLVNIPHISISPVVSFNAEMKQIVRHLSLAADSVKYKLTLLNEYVTQYPTSYPALWSLASLYSRFSYVGEMDLVLNILSKEFSSHNLYRYLEQQFAIRRELIHGAVFPFNTLAYGKQIKDLVPLARYTLIEFWATWCSPCIAQIPEWKRLYNETDRKTLNIIGIALEQPSNHAGLKKFIKKEHVKWANITDWRGIESDKLGIKSIPFNILLDHDGIIVDLNILPEALKKLLLFQVR